jgi:hypothetical protein
MIGLLANSAVEQSLNWPGAFVAAIGIIALAAILITMIRHL